VIPKPLFDGTAIGGMVLVPVLGGTVRMFHICLVYICRKYLLLSLLELCIHGRERDCLFWRPFAHGRERLSFLETLCTR